MEITPMEKKQRLEEDQLYEEQLKEEQLERLKADPTKDKLKERNQQVLLDALHVAVKTANRIARVSRQTSIDAAKCVGAIEQAVAAAQAAQLVGEVERLLAATQKYARVPKRRIA
jgi:hypothetical protein